MASGLFVSPSKFMSFDELKRAGLNKTEVATRSLVNGSLMSLFNMLPDPDPILRRLGKDLTAYKDLTSDDQVYSGMTRRKAGVKSREWKVMKDGDVTDKEVKFIEGSLNFLELNKCKVKDIIDQSLNSIFWGYSVFEVVWTKHKKYWLPVKVQEKPQDWFHFDDDNNLRLRTNENWEGIQITGEEADPDFKHRFILLRNCATYENPYGEKALSRCFWPVTFKRGGWRFFTVFIEKYGMPWVVAKQPRSADDKQATELLNDLENLVQDAVAVIPDDSSVDFMSSDKTASADVYEKYINLCNNSIDKVLLTNSLSTEQQNKGGYSSAAAGTEIEDDLAKQDLDFPEELFNELFRSIIDLNFGNGKYPRFGVYEQDDINKDLAERDNTLSQHITFNKPYFMKNYNLSEEDFDLRQQNNSQGVKHPGEETELEEESKQTVLKQSTGFSAEDFQSKIEEVLAPVVELAESGKSYKDVTEKLEELFPKMSSKKIEELLTKVIFISELYGRTDEQKERG